jgi:transposase
MSKRLGRPKLFSETSSVTITLDTKMLDHLKRQAAYLGQQSGSPVSLSETIRRGLQFAFPTDKQELLDF